MIRAIQKSDKWHVSTPANWMPGDDVIIPTPVTVDEAEAAMQEAGGDVNALDWFLRFKKDE